MTVMSLANRGAERQSTATLSYLDTGSKIKQIKQVVMISEKRWFVHVP